MYAELIRNYKNIGIKSLMVNILGIGMKSIAVLQSEKEVSFSVSTLTHSDQVWLMQSGSDVVSGTYTVQQNETAQCISGKFTIKGTPTGTTCIVIDKNGVQTAGTIALKEVTATAPIDGDWYTLIYSTAIPGTSISFDSQKFPKAYYIEFHTICYNTDGAIVADAYYIWNKAIGDGNLAGTFDGGKNTGDVIKFTALTPFNNTEIGRYVLLPRSLG